MRAAVGQNKTVTCMSNISKPRARRPAAKKVKQGKIEDFSKRIMTSTLLG
jgi:hypothetical protein